MSDIHIGTAAIKENGAGTIQVFYHFPVTAANYPADAERTIEAPNPGAGEETAIQAGTLAEYSEGLAFNINAVTPAQMADKVKARWQNVADHWNADKTKEYKYYGTTLAHE